MKKLSLALVATLFISSCRKDEPWPWPPFFELWKGEQTHGNVIATRNGQIWEASAFAYFFDKYNPDHFSLSFLAYSPDGILAESFAIINIPAATGSYQLNNRGDLVGMPPDSVICLFNLVHDDLDLTGGYYPAPWSCLHKPLAMNRQLPLSHGFSPVKVNVNKIWVDEIDTIAGTVKGRFDVVLERNPDDKLSKYPRAFHFQNGAFTARHWP